jgi:thiol-disulfide isomerase/thioredoxin
MANHEDNFDPLFHGIPHFEVQDFDGDKLLLLKGKYKIIMIFATWCGPCKAFKPQLRRLFDMHCDGEEICVGVINGSGEKTTLPSEVQLMKKIKHLVKGFPTIAFFDKEGNFIGTHEGKRTAEDVTASLQKLMKN